MQYPKLMYGKSRSNWTEFPSLSFQKNPKLIKSRPNKKKKKRKKTVNFNPAQKLLNKSTRGTDASVRCVLMNG